MATQIFYRMGMVCSIIAFVLMFIAFASPYWYKSWTRVHSPFANIGLWHVCLSGWMMPRDPVMKSYVGCWWIHSTEFELVADEIMPAWFRVIQFLCVVTVILDLVGAILILVFLLEGPRKRIYDEDRGRMFIINSILLLVSAFLVFIISLVFAEMSLDSDWMPRPWMNYLSWSYGFCVLSGFFSAFGGMLLFILGLIFKDKDRRELDNLDSAAEMRHMSSSERAKHKEDEALSERHNAPTHIPSTRFAPQETRFAPQEARSQEARFAPQEARFRHDTRGPPPPIAEKPAKVGESFV